MLWFNAKPICSQLILLEDAWRELFVLGIAQWAIPVDSTTLLAVSGMWALIEQPAAAEFSCLLTFASIHCRKD